MTICACCNAVLETERAYDHNLCPVCERSGCNAFHAHHDEAHLEAQEERKLEDGKRELTRE